MDRYYSYSKYLRNLFNERVHRVAVDAGFTCPNRDGSKGRGGCIYCYSGSDYNYARRTKVEEQIAKGIERVRRRYKAKKFLVYFQAYTNTYAPTETLKSVYDEIKNFPEVVGLIIGTRPDCVPDETLELINSYTDNYLVWIEYGLESSHFKSLRWMNRGHGVSDFVDAVLRTRKFPQIKVCVHTILGLPTEDYEDMMETADFLSALKVDGVKIHPLHVIKNTPLEKVYLEERFKLLTQDEYVDLVVDFIERLPEETIIQRITGEAPEELLIGPEWCSHKFKNKIIEMVRNKFKERNSYQGKKKKF